MDIEKVKSAQSQEEAHKYAIEWQQWASEQSLSWGELIDWYRAFEILAEKFDMRKELEENLWGV